MSSISMNELEKIQADMVVMEGMLEALAIGAYSGIKVEYIGNSLEVLKEYLGNRVDRLDSLVPPSQMPGRGKDLSDRFRGWEEFIAGNGNRLLQSEEVGEAYRKAAPYLEMLPDEKNRELGLLLKEIGAASRQQGFLEGFRAAGEGNGHGRRRNE